ncbi:hypothetical protein JOM56_011982 [Amanita muscaria]
MLIGRARDNGRSLGVEEDAVHAWEVGTPVLPHSCSLLRPEVRTSPLMAVVSEIPTEVMTEIFYLLCKNSINVCELDNSWCKETFPWAVGLVSRQWRTAFLSYPPIWASLTLSDNIYASPRMLNPNAYTESYAKEVNRRLALYLERSGGHPLRLDICLWSVHPKAFAMMVLEMLSACSHRWQTAKFDLFRDWPLDSILPCKGKMPTLGVAGNCIPSRLQTRPGHIRGSPLTNACIYRTLGKKSQVDFTLDPADGTNPHIGWGFRHRGWRCPIPFANVTQHQGTSLSQLL